MRERCRREWLRANNYEQYLRLYEPEEEHEFDLGGEGGPNENRAHAGALDGK